LKKFKKFKWGRSLFKNLLGKGITPIKDKKNEVLRMGNWPRRRII